jgi:hypothetical protein
MDLLTSYTFFGMPGHGHPRRISTAVALLLMAPLKHLVAMHAAGGMPCSAGDNPTKVELLRLLLLSGAAPGKQAQQVGPVAYQGSHLPLQV